MTESIAGHLYDYPKYYDLVFGSDWKAEFDFLVACFEKHAGRKVKRLFKPACGTGRLLIKLAQHGFEVSGNDLNPKAVDYCNQRMSKAGFGDVAVVGDMVQDTRPRSFMPGPIAIIGFQGRVHVGKRIGNAVFIWPAGHYCIIHFLYLILAGSCS
jgi:SAM-dependent methyltransferase